MSEQNTQPAERPAELMWCYRVERTSSTGCTMFSYGTRQAASPATAIADDAARQNRATHAYYNGQLTVWVWPARDDEHYRLPVPDDASVFSYEPGQPASETTQPDLDMTASATRTTSREDTDS